MAALMLLAVLAFIVVMANSQSLLPWENIVIPDDNFDEDDRKVNFDCKAECFGIKPSPNDPAGKRVVLPVLPHCQRRVPDMSVVRLGTTKMFISNSRVTGDWLTAYATCRKYNLDLLGQMVEKKEDDFVAKILKYVPDGIQSSYWLGASDLADSGKLSWADTGADISPTSKAGKVQSSSGGASVPRCLEVRVLLREVSFVSSPCVDNKKFICVMPPGCFSS